MGEKNRQPKYDKSKTPATEKGDGLEEFMGDQPNFQPGQREEKRRQERKKKDGFSKRPISALRFIPRHGGVLEVRLS